jgi:ABC-2 type transport system permease protein
MNPQSNAVAESFDSQRNDSPKIAPAVLSNAGPLYWSVRRELWENRSLYIAPLAAAALILFGFMIYTIHLPAKVRAAAPYPLDQHNLIEVPYDLGALLIMATTLIVAVFYCLDALYGERRDRSILFWKSLPVSDATTVLSKAIIPVVILPLITFAITVALQLVMLLLSGAVLLGSGLSVATVWPRMGFFTMTLGLLYHLMGLHGLGYAPIYGWLLLVSAWARRAPFLWATLPLLAIGIVEKIAFNTAHFADMMGYLIGGGDHSGSKASSMSAILMPHHTVGEFLTSADLWIGLATTAIFLFLAIRLRRYREPI